MRSKILQRVLDKAPKHLSVLITWKYNLIHRINYILDSLNKKREDTITLKDLDYHSLDNLTLIDLSKIQTELGMEILTIIQNEVKITNLRDLHIGDYVSITDTIDNRVYHGKVRVIGITEIEKQEYVNIDTYEYAFILDSCTVNIINN